MGILDRIQEDNARETVEEAERTLASQAIAVEIAAERSAIVHRKIAEFASFMSVECLELDTRDGARIFLFDDIVLAVRLRGTTDKGDLHKTARMEVLWQHTVAVVGVDIVESVREVAVGTLALVTYAGIRRAINLNSQLVFEHEQVLPHL